jgi:hypothetical protein
MDNKKNNIARSWKDLSKRILKEDNSVVEPEYIDGPNNDNPTFDDEIKKFGELIDFLHKNCKNLTKAVFFTTIGNLIENDFSELKKFVKKSEDLKKGSEKIMDKYHDMDDRLYDIRDTDSGYSVEMKNKADKWQDEANKLYNKLSLVEERLNLIDNVLDYLEDIHDKLFDGNERNEKLLSLMLKYE